MSSDLQAQLDCEWGLLHNLIREVLQQFGEEDSTEWNGSSLIHERRDYWLLDENWGNWAHRIEPHNPKMLMPAVIKSLQRLLTQYPNWEIIISVGGPQEEQQAAHGLVIRDDEIIDGLERQYLPREFQGVEYEGRRPAGSHFGDIMYSASEWPPRS